MPMYEYHCLDCHKHFDLLRSYEQRDNGVRCPERRTGQAHRLSLRHPQRDQLRQGAGGLPPGGRRWWWLRLRWQLRLRALALTAAYIAYSRRLYPSKRISSMASLNVKLE